MKQEYQFEKYLKQGRLDQAVIDARRFGKAVRYALNEMEETARCYSLQKEDYYLDTKEFLEGLLKRLTAEPDNENLDRKIESY